MKDDIKKLFPDFARSIDRLEIEDELHPLTEQEIANLEKELDIDLPPSYKQFLSCTKGFTALGGSIKIGEQHPFFHKFEPLSTCRTAKGNKTERWNLATPE